MPEFNPITFNTRLWSRASGSIPFDDHTFDQQYPANVRHKARNHWSSLEAVSLAAGFLADKKDACVLDIGSGVGKFCLAAARLKPNAHFYGVEQRAYLVDAAIKCKEKMGVKNAHFIHGNFTKIDFRNFDHFYFFNSFYENLVGVDKIDDKLEFSLTLFNYYNGCLFQELERKPRGTRIATFHSLEGEIPPTYYTIKTHFEGTLKFWIKA
jgi:SAM-dependent methyltransferase